MSPMKDGKEVVGRQFSLKSAWDRIVRMLAVGAAAVTALGHVPDNMMEWVGIVGAVLAASYTGK